MAQLSQQPLRCRLLCTRGELGTAAQAGSAAIPDQPHAPGQPAHYIDCLT